MQFMNIVTRKSMFPCRISVVQASGECLRGILVTKKGQVAFKSLEDHTHNWCLYLEPFRQQRKKKVNV